MHKTPIPLSILFVFVLQVTLFSCRESKHTINGGPTYDLVLLDSFQVNFQSEIHVTAFQDSKGIFYNFKEGSFTLFDTNGTVIRKKHFPSEGENALGYVSGIKMKPDGSILLQTLQGEIALLNDSLELEEKVIFPFSSVTSNLRSNIKSLDREGDDVYVYYPGSNGQNPLDKGYFKKNNLLEKIDLSTGERNSVLKLSPESKFNQDLYFEDPYLIVSISGNRLYFAFDNEPIIYEYDLRNTDALPIAIPIFPEKFFEVSGQPIPIGNVDGVYPGLIEGIFPFDGGFAVAYGEGLDKSTVDNLTNLHPKIVKSVQKNLLKIYHHGKGWSKEILLPSSVAAILGFDSPSADLYALQNEALFDGNSDTVTVYRFRLSEIE